MTYPHSLKPGAATTARGRGTKMFKAFRHVCAHFHSQQGCHDRRKPLARYGAMGGALARGLLCPTEPPPPAQRRCAAHPKTHAETATPYSLQPVGNHPGPKCRPSTRLHTPQNRKAILGTPEGPTG